mgnify:CR=1 FL=1
MQCVVPWCGNFLSFLPFLSPALDVAEHKQYYGPRLPGRRDYVAPQYKSTDMPNSVDWRESTQHGAPLAAVSLCWSVAVAVSPPVVCGCFPEHIISGIKDQGQCGSCWAHAATETMESYVALASGQLPVLSQQQVASCTKNPMQCGGTGGCQGATNELGMQSVVDTGGIAEEWTYPYQSYWGKDFACRYNDTNGGPTGTPAVATVTGYVRLPANNQTAVMEAISFVGPQAITVDAANWHECVLRGCWLGVRVGRLGGCVVVPHVSRLSVVCAFLVCLFVCFLFFFFFLVLQLRVRCV